MDDLENILANAKVNVEQINRQLVHPVLKTRLKHRANFEILKKAATDFFTKGIEPRMFGLSGLRGTGKTTLLWQTAEYIYKNITTNIYFINVNTLVDYNTNIRDFLQLLQTKELKKRFTTYDKPIVFLFDEVHEDPKWTNTLKILYDELKIAFILTTGSSALLLQTSADLAARMIIEHIFPLSFTEYLFIRNERERADIKQLQSNLMQTLFYSENIEQVETELKQYEKQINAFYKPVENLEDNIQNYIEYFNITRFCIYNETAFINKAITELYKRIIHEDIPIIAGKNAKYLHSEKLLRRLAASDEINIQTLSQAIGISQNDIYETLDILTKAELLNVLYPYGGIDSKINKARKYFFMSPSVRKVILNPLIGTKTNDDLLSKLLEDTVVMYLKRIFKMESVVSFSSQTKQKNPDLIIETLKKPIIFEIGINKRTTQQIAKSKIGYRYGVIINSKMKDVEIKDNVVFFPLKWFLML